MRGTSELPDIVAQKLAALDEQQSAFEASFQYVQDVQGLKRFATFPIANTVRYLGALVMCDAKDRLLSVPRTVDRYDGRYCLELLQRWQTGAHADVVAFLQRKLDALPFADISQQVEAARRDPRQEALVASLEHGRLVMLNRGFNLLQALEPLFTLPPADEVAQVRSACEASGYTPAHIADLVRALDGPLYAPLRHPALSQRNIQLMDRVGVRTSAATTPDRHDDAGSAAARVTPPFAQLVIHGYVALTAPEHNNPAGAR